jgi:pimeloyl-ACP methyl ester carboxylesterase
MIPAAQGLQSEYRNLSVPLVIAAGAEDKFVESEQSAKLHREIPQSTLRLIEGAGHMVHQTATSEIMSVIDVAGFGGATRRLLDLMTVGYQSSDATRL